MVGLPDLAVRPLAGRLEDAVPEIEFEAAYEELLERSPLLRAARARAAAAEAQVCREQRSRCRT